MKRFTLVGAGLLVLAWSTAQANQAATTQPMPGEPTATPPPPVTNVEINTPPPVVVPPPATAPAPVAPIPPPPAYYDNRPRYLVSGVGAGIMVGGGVQDFTAAAMRNATETGGFWTARLLMGTRRFVGFEAAYVGGAQNINALGLDTDALLVSNGVEGNMRINVPLSRQAILLEPFGFVGAGWSHYHVARTVTNTSSIASNDDILAVPYGVGLAVGAAGFIADARFTYRSTFYDDILHTTSSGQLNNWSAGAQVGFEF